MQDGNLKERGKTMQDLKIIEETNHFLLVQKPVNIPSQADKTEDTDMLSLVKQYLKEKYQKPGNVYVGLVHRLDRPVRWAYGVCKNIKSSSKTKRASTRA